MEKLNDLRTQLMSFNSDPIVSRIREKYNTPSFFEMIDKTRSETAHSAFLGWMLKGQGVSKTTADTPLNLFLSLLVKRCLQQETADTPLMDPAVIEAILSRKIRLSNVETETDKSVSELAELAYDHCGNDDKRSLLSQIIATVGDRVDLVVKCKVEDCGCIDQLLLVIENKIDSPEGTAKAIAKRKGLFMPTVYTNLSQTERYYLASYQEAYRGTAVIYVFLNPKTTESDLAGIQDNRDTLKKEGKIAQSNNYININYQDILNDVIDKALLLQEDSMSKRTRNFLEEYRNEIFYPHIEDPKTHINIAYPKIDGVEDLWKRFRFLFHCIVYSTVFTKGCVAVEKDSETSYYSTSDQVSIPASLQSWFTGPTTTINDFCDVLSKNGIQSQPINYNELQSADVLDMLGDFANKNLEIMATILGAIKISSLKYAGEADELLSILMSNTRDNTRYYVSYNGCVLTPTPALKGEVAYLVIQHWGTITDLPYSDGFPDAINPYLDSSECRSIMVWELWRNEAFEFLIDHIKNNLGDYAKNLSIEDTLGNQIL